MDLLQRHKLINNFTMFQVCVMLLLFIPQSLPHMLIMHTKIFKVSHSDLFETKLFQYFVCSAVTSQYKFQFWDKPQLESFKFKPKLKSF